MTKALLTHDLSRHRALGFDRIRKPGLNDTYVLGMPHLAFGGLSETWFLKELGHRHWLMLAEAAGLSHPDFRDADGARVYAAFTSVSIRNAAFDAAREHQALAISSSLVRVSRTQFASRHGLAIGGRSIGTVELTSAFVKRLRDGQNRSIARIEIAGFASPAPSDKQDGFFATAALLRSGRWRQHMDFVNCEGRPSARLEIDPCPAQDFNGADFLYFAAFQAFIDRAEWALLRPPQPAVSTIDRDIIYHGNVEIGERVSAVLLDHRRADEILAHRFRLESADGRLLAEVFTLRRVKDRRPASPASGI